MIKGPAISPDRVIHRKLRSPEHYRNLLSLFFSLFFYFRRRIIGSIPGFEMHDSFSFGVIDLSSSSDRRKNKSSSENRIRQFPSSSSSSRVKGHATLPPNPLPPPGPARATTRMAHSFAVGFEYEFAGTPSVATGKRQVRLPQRLRPRRRRRPDPRKEPGRPFEDTVMVAEFSEQVGPRPLLLSSCGGDAERGEESKTGGWDDLLSSRGSDRERTNEDTDSIVSFFDPNEFAVRIMSVDASLPPTNEPNDDVANLHLLDTSFRLAADSVVVHLETSGETVASHVRHFTLYDLSARGFVRPFCVSYVTRDDRKLTRRHGKIDAALREAVDLWRLANLRRFSRELEMRLIDLGHTKGRMIELQQGQSPSSPPQVRLDATLLSSVRSSSSSCYASMPLSSPEILQATTSTRGSTDDSVFGTPSNCSCGEVESGEEGIDLETLEESLEEGKKKGGESESYREEEETNGKEESPQWKEREECGVLEPDEKGSDRTNESEKEKSDSKEENRLSNDNRDKKFTETKSRIGPMNESNDHFLKSNVYPNTECSAKVTVVREARESPEKLKSKESSHLVSRSGASSDNEVSAETLKCSPPDLDSGLSTEVESHLHKEETKVMRRDEEKDVDVENFPFSGEEREQNFNNVISEERKKVDDRRALLDQKETENVGCEERNNKHKNITNTSEIKGFDWPPTRGSINSDVDSEANRKRRLLPWQHPSQSPEALTPTIKSPPPPIQPSSPPLAKLTLSVEELEILTTSTAPQIDAAIREIRAIRTMVDERLAQLQETEDAESEDKDAKREGDSEHPFSHLCHASGWYSPKIVPPVLRRRFDSELSSLRVLTPGKHEMALASLTAFRERIQKDWEVAEEEEERERKEEERKRRKEKKEKKVQDGESGRLTVTRGSFKRRSVTRLFEKNYEYESKTGVENPRCPLRDDNEEITLAPRRAFDAANPELEPRWPTEGDAEDLRKLPTPRDSDDSRGKEQESRKKLANWRRF